MTGLTDAVGRASSRAASYAAICLLTVCTGTFAANAETRTLKFYHLHTHEKEEIAYKRDGRYIPDGLKKINWILRDWRKQQPVNMDPRLLDLVWEAYRQSGSRSYIQVICGYRSADTNGMLRSRTSGVARESQHMLGKALDFTLPDVPLAKMRAIGLKMQIGGVGYYPKSGSPFVHFDVGNVRHWPKMSRRELLAVFPSGNTLHVPSDGKPLPGYEQALASYKSRKSATSIEVANAGASSGSPSGGRSLLAMLFGGGGADEEEDNAEADSPAPARAVFAKPVKPEAPARKSEAEPVAVAALVAKPKREVLPNGVSLPIRDTFDASAPKAPVPPAPLTEETKPAPVEVAALDPTRIPLPSAAPARQTTLIAEAMNVPVPSKPVGAPAKAEAEDEALLAALAASPSAEDVAAKEGGQLAYSVPTPRSRPPFASILKDVPAPAPAPTVVAEAMPTAPAVEPPANPTLAAHAVEPKLPVAEKVLLASLGAERKTGASAPAKLAIPEGKTGRFKRGAVAAGASGAKTMTKAAVAVRMANLVTDPNARQEVRRMAHPNAATLVRSAPTSVLATGFTSEPIASSSTYSFAGTAVNFLPMIKVD